MSVSVGDHLGPYEILAPIGAGGMGEVYKARDSRLDRIVAVKVSQEHFSERFEREARAVAALNHPHVCTLHDVGPNYLVMEFVDGTPLAGPLPVEKALDYASQILDALDHAHRKGITHRDLKPANILVTRQGVKLLDFGLAKFKAAPLKETDATLTKALTQGGQIVGTLQYMSPEQLQGKEADARSDLFSFGCVLYEMLTGKRAFDGSSSATVIAAILERPTPEGLPPALDRVLKRCLEKDPDQRFQTARDLKAALDWSQLTPAPPVMAGASPSKSPWIAAAVLALIAAALGLAYYRSSNSQTTPLTRLSIALPPGEQVTTIPAISRDGRTIAYAAGRTLASSQLYVRTLDDFAAHAVSNSGGAQYPFFSPDGRTVAFFAGGKLRRAAVSGGAATDLAPAPVGYGGAWTDGGRIVYAPILISGLWRIRADGGAPEQVTKPDGAGTGYAHVFPQRLPGTDDLVFTFWGRTFYAALLSSKTGAWRQVTPPSGPLSGWYAASGHILANDGYGSVRAGSWNPAMTMPVSPDTVVLENVNWLLGRERSWLDVSDNGTAVYVPGNPSHRHLVWLDRHGVVTQVPGDADQITEAVVSRDGRRLAYGGKGAEWVVDLASGARTRVVSDAAWTFPGAWLPGDQRLVVPSNKDGDWDLFSVGASSSGDVKPLLQKQYAQFPQAAGPDGSVVYLEYKPDTGYDLWTLHPDGKTEPLVVTPFNESAASVSADGRYVAYMSDESGRREVYAIPASGKGERVTVSIDGGAGPVWSRDGKELFYRAGDDLMSVQVNTAGPLKLGERKRLLDLSAYDSGSFHEFDVSADGQRFLLIRTDPDSRPVRLDVVINWFDDLRRKSPVK